MDELVDIVDREGNFTGKTCMKSVAHANGYWHPCVHIWLYNLNGEVLIQKRVATKDTFPDRWDVSVAGHIGAGENIKLAAQRELSEELGVAVDLNQLEFIGNFTSNIEHNKQLIDREYHHVFMAKYEGDIAGIALQEEEVAEVKLIPWIEIDARVKSNKDTGEFVPYDDAYYSMVFEAIKNKTKGM